MNKWGRIPWLVLLPPIMFIALFGLFYSGMMREDPDALPSAFVGRTAPDLELASLGDFALPEIENINDFIIVNFWASWCGPCRQEHPILMDLANSGMTIFGVNYKDRPSNALNFLAELGNPYDAVGSDTEGSNGFNWGVYGIPETFVVDPDGHIVLRFAGPVTRRVLGEKILPVIRANASPVSE